MRIAIVGAGLAGLACAHELERLGFAPDIFEKRPTLGKPVVVTETMAQFLHVQPHQDIMQHLRDDLKLPVNPANSVTRAVLHSADREATLTGHLGYTTVRGGDPRSLERQLERHLRSKIRFGAEPDVTSLAAEYDWVVVATGDRTWSAEYLQWETDVVWSVQGAIVTGDFFPGEIRFFFHTRYAGTGYAQIAPMDERTATVGIGIPNTTPEELERCWETFRREQGHRWEREESTFTLPHLECGRVRNHVLGNVLLAGTAGGFVETLGMTGQCAAMESGVCAARQVALNDRSLERFARRWRVYYQRVHRLRRVVNSWTDAEMDSFVQRMRYAGSLVVASPWNLLQPAGLVADLLRLPDDPSPGVGWD